MIFLKEINIELAEKLSMLDLCEEERIKFKSDLLYILRMADEILKINTEGVEETFSVSFTSNITREDEEAESEQLFNGYITVPGIME